MTPEQQVAFTRRFGPLHIMVPRDCNLPEHPEVWVVGNAEQDGKAIGLRGAGMGFHSDGEDKPVPNAGSFLYALQVPPEGGDTLFADMYAAHEALPAGDPPQDRRKTRALQPQRAAPSELPAPASRAGTSRAAGRVPPARTASSEERPRVAVSSAAGPTTSRDCRSRRDAS